MKRKNDKIVESLENSFGDWFDGKFETPKMTKKLYPYDKMFSPIKVNRLTIKNRLVMGPMGNISMCDETGRPNAKMLKYFEERAKGGVGLITTGLIPTTFGIDTSIKELGNLTYFPRVDRSRTVLAGWRDLAQMVHSHNCNIFIQLTAGLGRVGNPQCLVTQLKLPVSASWNPNFYIPQIPCKRLSTHKIKKIVKKTGQAAADAKACNIDGIYLHGHEGYLMEQLTNPAFNRRKLGRYANYERFGIDMVKEIRKRCGKNIPIMYRIDLSLALNETYGDKMKSVKSLKKFKNGRTIDQTLTYMKHLVEAGVDMFDVDLGCYDNWWLPHPPATMPSGCFLDIAQIAKDYFKKNNVKSNAGLDVPVVGVGKLGYPDLAEQALRDEKCDMIMLARPLLADPEWPNKAYKGDVKHIRPCIGCQEGCIQEFVDGGHPQCAVCARTAFEEEFSKDIAPAKTSKKVAVIGAGPAGVNMADVLLKRGHSVDLYDKNKKVGGTLIAASVPKIKYELLNYVKYLEEVVADLSKNKKFNLYLDSEVTSELLKEKKYDAIVFATGSKIRIPAIEGLNGKNVHTVTEVLNKPSLVSKAQNVTIIGGGDSGCECAYMMAYELKKNVTIVEMMPTLMSSTCTANRGHLLHYLEKANVNILNCTKLKAVKDGKVLVSRNISKTVPTPFNTWQPILPENINNPLAKKIKEKFVDQEIDADVVIVAIGTISENELYQTAVKEHLAKEIYNVGDSIKPGKVFMAVKSAYRTARDI